MSLSSPSTGSHLFSIKTDDPGVYRQAKIIRVFVIVLSIVSLVQVAVDFFVSPVPMGPGAVGLNITVVAWAIICLVLLRNGRLLSAMHSFFIIFNAVCFLLPLLNENAQPLHYLTLATVTAVALIHSISISAGYAIGIMAIAIASSFSAGLPDLSGLIAFILTALGVSAVSWLSISTYQKMADGNETAVSVPPSSQSPNQDRVNELRTLYQLSNHLSLAPTLTDIFSGARREIMALVDATGMSISLVTPTNDKLNWIYGYENGQEVDLTAVPLLSIDEGFSGYVVRTREVLHVTSQSDELYKKLHSRTVGEESDAWLGLPMIVANEIIGVLAVENTTPFNKHAIDLLTAAANSIATAIHNLIQFETVQTALSAQSKQRILMQAAAEVAAATTSILDINTLMQEAVDLIKERFVMYYVGLFLVNHKTDQAVLKAGTGDAGREQIENKFQLPVGGRSLIGGVTLDGKPRIVQDVRTNTEWLENTLLPQTRSESVLPLRVRGEISGALTIQSASENAFSPELIGALQTISDQLAVAIDNARLLTRTEARVQRQQKLNQISGQMYRTVDVDEIVRIGLQSLSELYHNEPIDLLLGHQPSQNEDM